MVVCANLLRVQPPTKPSLKRNQMDFCELDLWPCSLTLSRNPCCPQNRVCRTSPVARCSIPPPTVSPSPVQNQPSGQTLNPPLSLPPSLVPSTDTRLALRRKHAVTQPRVQDWVWDVAQSIECLPSRPEALGPSPALQSAMV